MRYLLFKSKVAAAARSDEPGRDDVSTYEKLKVALEDRVRLATNDRERERAKAELAEYVRVAGKAEARRKDRA